MWKDYKIAYILLVIGLASCSPQVATSFWHIGTPSDSLQPGYTVIEAEGKTRHCTPITQWTATPDVDTYHQLHHHGVAVESDLMAYRIYFDKKQTIDVYAKKTPQLELSTSHWYPDSAQLAHHYGDDILRVSGTVGIGSVKYWNGNKMVHIEPIASRSQRIVSCTRNKAVMEISVRDWQVEGKTVDMIVQYTIQAHHRDMLCEVWLSEPLNNLCTGVQAVPAKQTTSTPKHFYVDADQDGVVLGSWGTDYPVNDTIHYAKETVGLGVYVPTEYAGEVVGNTQNNLVLFAPKKHLRFYLTTIAATKEDNPPASTSESFESYLRQWAESLPRKK